jgi:exosortase E/protease (VPEID-CTERM system)
MVAVTTKPPNTVPHCSHLLSRWLFLLMILTIEFIGITAWFEVPVVENNAHWPAWLFANSREIWKIGVWSAGTSLLALSPRFQAILGDLRVQSSGYRWSVWLACHSLALAAFILITLLVFGKPADPARLSAAWFAGWFTLASTTFLLWLLALAPGHFWLRLVRQEYTALLMGVLLGICVWMLVGMLIRQEAPLAQKELWNALSDLTLRLVYSLLGWVYSDLVLVYLPETSLVGTASFFVEISYPCSGVEGISLITLFLALYLWLFRKDLRFPQAFWLFPLGIVVIWLANVVRIAMLITIGTSFSPEIALRGFHTHAGWIAFTLIAFGAIALSHRMLFITIIKPDPVVVKSSTPLAVALLVPFLVLLAASMVVSALSSGFDLWYPLQVVAAAAFLWHYRQAYQGLGWSGSWQAVAIGGGVFLLWMLLEPQTDSTQTALARGLAELSAGAAAVWLAFRVFGSVIIVPLVEELAFRSYLLRKLIARDFENVPLGQFTWVSLIGSSVLFGLLHGRWVAGILAGLAYAWAVYRRGQIGDAVLAHIITNILIAFYVVVQQRWGLWS